MKIAVINNYDSFVYNLVHYLESFDGLETEVFLNDKVYMEDLDAFDKILLSPGPGLPKEAGKLLEIIDHFKEKKSILGVCLGHQAIAEYFDCQLINLKKPLHGTTSKLRQITDDFLWKDVPKETTIGHYHSWCVDPEKVSEAIIVTAIDEWGNIMALKHKNLNLRGIQFHPESILTPEGKKMLENWVFQ